MSTANPPRYTLTALNALRAMLDAPNAEAFKVAREQARNHLDTLDTDYAEAVEDGRIEIARAVADDDLELDDVPVCSGPFVMMWKWAGDAEGRNT